MSDFVLSVVGGPMVAAISSIGAFSVTILIVAALIKVFSPYPSPYPEEES